MTRKELRKATPAAVAAWLAAQPDTPETLAQLKELTAYCFGQWYVARTEAEGMQRLLSADPLGRHLFKRKL